MKKLFDGIVWVFILAILFSSCTSSDSTIVGRGVDNQGHWVLDTASSKVYQSFDSLYKVSPNYHEKVLLAQKDGTEIWAILLAILGTLVVAYGSIMGASSKGSFLFVAIICAGIAIVCAAAKTIDWSHTKEADIPKTTYDSTMKADGNLQKWWIDQGNLFK